MRSALRENWPEYLIEGWALGCFMISVGVFATILYSPRLPIYGLVPSETVRTLLLALAMGITAIVLINSPWGKRSGAHMNPAVTLAFLHLGKIRPYDALFFAIAQSCGAVLGVLLVAAVARGLFADPPVSYAVTVPGPAGITAAFVAEVLISFGLMSIVLMFSSSPRLMRFTGLAVGCVLALCIAVELPFSGTSMNPARTLATAISGMNWHGFWIYLLAPPLGMLASAQLHLYIRGSPAAGCAKLQHPDDVRCIHCGHRPEVGSGRGDDRGLPTSPRPHSEPG
jgi:aquaporin Z